jgi:hypothetical protein
MAERTLVAYRNGYFMDMYNLGTVRYRLGTVRYRLVVQFNLDVRMLQLDRC